MSMALVMKGLKAASAKFSTKVSTSELKVLGKEMRSGLKARGNNYSADEYASAFSNKFNPSPVSKDLGFDEAEAGLRYMGGATGGTGKIGIGSSTSTPGFSNVAIEDRLATKAQMSAQKSAEKAAARQAARAQKGPYNYVPENQYPGTSPISQSSVPKTKLDQALTRNNESLAKRPVLDARAENVGLKSREELQSLYKEKPELAGLTDDELKNHLSYTDASPSKSAQRKIFEKQLGMSKGKIQQIDSAKSQFDSDILAIKDQAGRAEIGKKYNIAGHESMNESQMAGSIMNHHAKKLEGGPSTMDHIIGNKYHTKAAGGLITAGVVSSLFSSRGQQSNAQLYNQTPGPGQ